jgi:hypothetical protein
MNIKKTLIASPPWTVEEQEQLRSLIVQGQTALEIGRSGPNSSEPKTNSTSHDKARIAVKACKIHAAGKIGLKMKRK